MATSHRAIVLGWQLDHPNELADVQAPELVAHAAVIAQSGSGKSFVLGRLIEEILLRTSARVCIVDVNGDFRKFHLPNDKAWDANERRRIGRLTLPACDGTRRAFVADWCRRIKMRRITRQTHDVPGNAIPAKISWSAIDVLEQMDVLECVVACDTTGLYPELAALRELAAQSEVDTSPPGLIKQSRTEGSKFTELVKTFAVSIGIVKKGPLKEEKERRQQRLAESMDHLGELRVWRTNGGDQDLRRVLCEPRREWDVSIIDLPSLPPNARLLVVNYALHSLWESAQAEWANAMAGPPDQDKRVPTFVLIDEAQNFVPSEPRDKLAARVHEMIAIIAAEGRKYGLFVILATQRPAKVSRAVLAECENVCILRLQSPLDHQIAADTWGVSSADVSRTRYFNKGDGLLLGRWVASPTAFHAAYRRTAEGGANLRAEYWTRRRRAH